MFKRFKFTTTSTPTPTPSTNASRTLRPPHAPPDHLRLTSFQIFSRLLLIPSFRPWLLYTRTHVPRRKSTSTHFELLYDCIAFGAPLGTLLVLLGAGAPPVTVLSGVGGGGGMGWRDVDPEEFDFVGVRMEEREKYFVGFVGRVQMLEAQGRLGYGEVLKSEDFLSGTVRGFGKVLRTVYRLLVALEETYPGIFVVPNRARERRKELIMELVDTEKAHAGILRAVFDAATAIGDGLGFMEPCLECFLVNRAKLLQYHERLLKNVESLVENTSGVRWTEIFGLDDDATRTKIFGAYRILCINYLSLISFLENTEFEPSLVLHAQTILENASPLLSRISNYTLILQDILDVTLPPDDRFYNSLCEAVLRLTDISETMNEVSLQLRTMRSAQILKDRMYVWTVPDLEELGVLHLDDRVLMITNTDMDKDEGRGTATRMCSLFFYETLLLCCTEGFDWSAESAYDMDPGVVYPIYKWEMGPALRRKSALDIVHAIEVARIDRVECMDMSSIRISWVDQGRVLRDVVFVGMSYAQWKQWIEALEPFVPSVYHLPASSVPRVTLDQRPSNWGEPLSEDENEIGDIQTHARPWSVIARKGPRSESSSFIDQAQNEDSLFLVISPEILPRLFKDNAPEYLRSPSPLSLNHALVSSNRPPTPPVEDGFASSTNPTGVLDLTGKVMRQGQYPSAHGGFSDVWKGVWLDRDRPRNVAVKVLRAKIDDPELEEKMVRRLHHELSIWKNLDHPNILGLLGTTSDFGHYASMVCPWMESGSMSKHMERCGDIMSTADRMKLLCEVAEGLSYLHSCSIVHGDLTGSNILITDDGKACLCDFGLSTILAEFHSTSYLTSTIGGAVRWADVLLYHVHTGDDEELQSEPTLKITMQSDIYSFGSVMLEILSGRIPYHYIRTDVQVVIELHKGIKPRRPAQSFVSDKQWEFITRCWDDDLDKRPTIGEVCRMMQVLYQANLS